MRLARGDQRRQLPSLPRDRHARRRGEVVYLGGFVETRRGGARSRFRPLDGFEFLTMAEAGEVGHWGVLKTLNELAKFRRDPGTRRLGAPDSATALRRRHPDIARSGVRRRPERGGVVADMEATTTLDSAEAEQVSRLKRYDKRVEEWLASLRDVAGQRSPEGTWARLRRKSEGCRRALGQDGRAGEVEKGSRRPTKDASASIEPPSEEPGSSAP